MNFQDGLQQQTQMPCSLRGHYSTVILTAYKQNLQSIRLVMVTFMMTLTSNTIQTSTFLTTCYNYFFSGPLPQPSNIDLAYVVESSDSVDWPSWRRYILKSALRYFKVTNAGNRVGLITYSDQAKVDFPFNAPERWDVLINKTPQQGGSGRRVDLALQLATDELFTGKLGSRTGARKVLLSCMQI